MLNNQIINWYFQNKRDLPWRKSKNPYFIWISEIMLQQTRVATALEHYHRFILKFPTISDLAEAEEQDVLNIWQGIGYYSRARNLHKTAKIIRSEYKGIFPKTYDEIIKLKGIGPYTAAAIASFAYNLPYAAVDGNVFRVLSRIYGASTAIDTSKGKKLFQELALQTMGNAEPQVYNQAIMEFGALLCTPKMPKCNVCPLQSNCYAYNNNMVERLPVKTKQITPKDRYFYYLFLSCNNQLVIEKREGGDIWKNMYQYPLIELDKAIEPRELTNLKKWKELVGNNGVIKHQTECIIHKLTHQNLHTTFIHIEPDFEYFKMIKKFQVVMLDELENYPFPKLIENHLLKWTKTKNL